MYLSCYNFIYANLIISNCVLLLEYTLPKLGEMDLTASETIIILDNSSETGWWRGRRQNGEEGFFPSNFVKVIN